MTKTDMFRHYRASTVARSVFLEAKPEAKTPEVKITLADAALVFAAAFAVFSLFFVLAGLL